MKTSLKGGLIGTGIAVILMFSSIILGGAIGEYAEGILIVLGLPWGIILGAIFMSSTPYISDAQFVSAYNAGGFVCLILNGFIIGLIIGKILSKSNKKKRK